MPNKKAPYNQNSAIRSAIRRTFSRSPAVREVMMKVRKEFPKFNKDGSRAKKDAVCYLCNVCDQYKGSTKVAVDHKEPVISVEDGFIDWNTFVERLFCAPENLQVICDECHQKKTNKERFDRSFKVDEEILTNIERLGSVENWDIEYVTKFTKKFTTKKLLIYPEDFVKRIVDLKEKLRSTKNKNKR